MTSQLQKTSVKIGKHAQIDLDEETTANMVGLTCLQLAYGTDTDHHLDDT